MGSESKKRVSVSDLDEILRVLKEKKSDLQINKKHNSILIEKGSKNFEVHKDGTVKGSMPLHSFHTHSAKSLDIDEEEIEVHYNGGTYVFKI